MAGKGHRKGAPRRGAAAGPPSPFPAPGSVPPPSPPHRGCCPGGGADPAPSPAVSWPGSPVPVGGVLASGPNLPLHVPLPPLGEEGGPIVRPVITPAGCSADQVVYRVASVPQPGHRAHPEKVLGRHVRGAWLPGGHTQRRCWAGMYEGPGCQEGPCGTCCPPILPWARRSGRSRSGCGRWLLGEGPHSPPLTRLAGGPAQPGGYARCWWQMCSGSHTLRSDRA